MNTKTAFVYMKRVKVSKRLFFPRQKNKIITKLGRIKNRAYMTTHLSSRSTAIHTLTSSSSLSSLSSSESSSIGAGDGGGGVNLRRGGGDGVADGDLGRRGGGDSGDDGGGGCARGKCAEGSARGLEGVSL